MKAGGAGKRDRSPERPYWTEDVAGLLARLDSRETGLSTSEARERAGRSGPNSLRPRVRFTNLRLLARQLESPLVLILAFAAGIAAIVHDWIDAVIVLVILASSVLLAFVHEARASAAVERLQARVQVRARVMRDGVSCELPLAEIVPGDVVQLAAGSLVPADGVVIDARDLFVSQSALTGEAFPVEKRPGSAAEETSLAERTQCLFMGSSVRSGTGRMLVVGIGSATVYGAVSERLRLRAPETDFERAIRQYGYLLLRIVVVLVTLVFAANVVMERPRVESLLFALALAVGISPELLPAIIEITLSRGAQDMAAHGVIVRRLGAIESLGSMDVLCTDKTGTLTEGVLSLESALDPDGVASDRVLHRAWLNASLQTGLSSPLDEAILAIVSARSDQANFKAASKIDEIPYDFVRKRLTVVLRDEDPTRALLVTKGALQEVLEACDRVRQGEDAIPLVVDRVEAIRARFAACSGKGYRVLGVATVSLPGRPRFERSDERGMTFEGFLLFRDPPKAGVAGVLGELRRLGVSIKVITGDNRFVTRQLAEQVGFQAPRVLTGRDMLGLSDEALRVRVQATELFAEVDPNQKERILLALKRQGHVVGFLGDGINDAPALHVADAGISVDQAVDVAKEAADFVLLEHDLDVLRRGIELGRSSLANTLKYVSMTTSANFGNMLSTAVASFFLPFLPLLAKQILLNNLLSDVPAMGIPSDRVDRERIERPGRWELRRIRDFMLAFGLISSAFDGLAF
ncbi:MAG TPA: magnesium-translocating P-type ATPase, partial [Myxococcota bacterium]|nr:magnesium-translocating P-type ATPase [Myxococcota bacterium]